MGDGGLALGAAVAAAQGNAIEVESTLSDVGLGPEYPDCDIAASLEQAALPFDKPDDLPDAVATLLASDQIVLWFEGRMEYGPRALGRRSVLARPDRPSLRDRLNRVLKQRVWYQPFCPSMLESDAVRILEDYDGASNRNMTMAYMVAPRFREAMVGVTSIDGTCRPHIVSDDAGGRFAELLRVVKTRTGSSVVLNTSYNIHGEPLVCSPAEAIDVYQRTKADALAIGSYLSIRRPI
jgi:carbamoyltransferase